MPSNGYEVNIHARLSQSCHNIGCICQTANFIRIIKTITHASQVNIFPTCMSTTTIKKHVCQPQRVHKINGIIPAEHILIYSASATTRRYAVPDSHPQVSGRGKPSTPPRASKNKLHGASISGPTDSEKATRTGRQLKGKSSFLSAVRQAHGRWCFRVSGLVALLFPGVAFLVGLLQVLNGQFGVGLEHIQGFMAEQFLDVVHIGAAPD